MTTKANALRFRKLHDIGCICCKINGSGFCGPTEIHHIVDKGYRKHSGGDAATLPLGMWHHRAVPHANTTMGQMTLLYGPSLANGSKPFHARFGTQLELLDKVNRELK